MYWESPLVARAVELELVPARALERLERRVRRLAGDLPPCDSIWADVLRQAKLVTRYQAEALVVDSEAANRTCRLGSDDARPPLRVGSCMVLDCVGTSDLGATYRCRLAGRADEVAVKRIDSRWVTSDAVRERLMSETAAWAGLAHAAVLPVTQIDVERGCVAMIAAWKGGRSLADFVRAGRRLSSGAALVLARELVTALAAADARQLVHGDLRPSNLLVDDAGRVWLADCGVRRAIAGAGLSIARNLPPHRYDYVAPEVAAGAPADAAGDLYALGCVLYHLVSGRPPFVAADAARKCAAHRAGRPVAPRQLGIEIAPDLRQLFEALIQPDLDRRVRSYNELLNLFSPAAPRGAALLRREMRDGVRPAARRLADLHALWRGSRRLGPTTPSALRFNHDRESSVSRLAPWFVAVVFAGAAAAVAVPGVKRVLPLLSIGSTARTPSMALAAGSNETPTGRSPDAATVTALWNASDDLRNAVRDCEPNRTIVLKSPGPFLLDAIDIAKPLTIRGADGVRPIFLGGPGATLRITAAGVRLENLHFVRVADRLPGQRESSGAALVTCLAATLALRDCSFIGASDSDSRDVAIAWAAMIAPDGLRGSGDSNRATLDASNLMFRNVAAAVDLDPQAATDCRFENCVHLGPGPLVRSRSPAGRTLDAIELRLNRVTVHGAATIEHRFPHPIDDALPLAISADESLLLPRDGTQPLITVRYERQLGVLMPKVSWSGSDSLCPADATMIEVRRGDAPPWQVVGFAAWKAYWGSRATGLIGVHGGFAEPPRARSHDLPEIKVARGAAAGADFGKLVMPSAVTLEQLPLLVERLSPR